MGAGRRLHRGDQASEFTSGSTIRIAEIARDCDLPDGVFNVVTGYCDPVGQAFAEHPATDFMSFTGSFRLSGGRAREECEYLARALIVV